MCGGNTELGTIVQQQDAEICVAETRSVGQNSLKDAIEIPGRTRNRVQNVSGRSLLRQRSVPFASKPRDLALLTGGS
jgi:hypothetical protein